MVYLEGGISIVNDLHFKVCKCFSNHTKRLYPIFYRKFPIAMQWAIHTLPELTVFD